MSYNNNWVKTLTESYMNNQTQPSTLQDLQEQIDINKDLLMLIDVLCEELGIDIEDLLNEDVQTDERNKEMEDEIAKIDRYGGSSREKDPRIKSLRKKQREERASEKIIDKGGVKIGTIGKARSLKDAEKDKDLARKNLERSKERGHNSRSDRRAYRAADDRNSALWSGQWTHDQKRQEERLGIKPSLGKRIKRAWRKWRGTEITPTDVQNSDKDVFSVGEKY